MTETEIAVAITDHENKIENLSSRVAAAEQNINQIHELVTSVKLLAQKQDDLITSVSEMRAEMKEVKDAPAKKWTNATQTIISGVISAIVAAACATILKFM